MRYFTQCRSIRSPQGRKGFTLLEMAIGLVAVGMMTSIVLQNTGGGKTSDAYTKTRAQLADMQAGLDRFAKRNGYYPMPASTTPASTAVQGISVTSSGDSGITNVAADGVLIGNFPYTTLGMAASYQTDQFKNGKDSAFRYMVSTRLTTASNYKANSGKGVIAISPDKATPTSGAVAAYAIVSHGEIAGCSAPGGTAIVNCGATGTVYNFTFNKGAPGINTTVSTSSNYFDDVLVYNATNLTDCSGTVSWGNCTATIDAGSAIPIGQSTPVTNTNPQSTGSATFSCTLAGTPQIPTLKIVGTGSCGCNAGQTLTWGSGANKCSATTSGKLASTATNDATNAANTDEVLTSTGTTGTATARCVNGALVIAQESSPTCGSATSCTGGDISWNASGVITAGTDGPCTATMPATVNSGASQQVVDANGGATQGSVTVTCDSGTLKPAAGSPVTCNASYPGVWIEGDCLAQSCGTQEVTDAPYCWDGLGYNDDGTPLKLADSSCNPAEKPTPGQACDSGRDCEPCTLPWGGTLAAGGSVKAYHPTQCTSTMLTCKYGQLSGPGGTNVSGGLYVTTYNQATPSATACGINRCFAVVSPDNTDMLSYSYSHSSYSYNISGTTFSGGSTLISQVTKVQWNDPNTWYRRVAPQSSEMDARNCTLQESEYFIDVTNLSSLSSLVLGNVSANSFVHITVNGTNAFFGPYANSYQMELPTDTIPIPSQCSVYVGYNICYPQSGVRLNPGAPAYGTPVIDILPPSSYPHSWYGCDVKALWNSSSVPQVAADGGTTINKPFQRTVDIRPMLHVGRNSVKIRTISEHDALVSLYFTSPPACSQ